MFIAERQGFEPRIPFWSIHAFQACLFNHSSISPWLIAKKEKQESVNHTTFPFFGCKSSLFFCYSKHFTAFILRKEVHLIYFKHIIPFLHAKEGQCIFSSHLSHLLWGFSHNLG